MISWGPVGVFLLAILDSAGVPLPGGVDALLITVAALDPDSANLSALLAIAGSIIGSMVLFWLARRGGEKFLDRYTATGRGALFKRWFLKYGVVTVFVPALVPIPMPMKVFVLSAGALGVRPLTFLVVVLAARIPRYFALSWLGAQMGSDSVRFLREHAWELVGVAVALTIFLILLIRISEKLRKPAVSYPG